MITRVSVCTAELTNRAVCTLTPTAPVSPSPYHLIPMQAHKTHWYFNGKPSKRARRISVTSTHTQHTDSYRCTEYKESAQLLPITHTIHQTNCTHRSTWPNHMLFPFPKIHFINFHLHIILHSAWPSFILFNVTFFLSIIISVFLICFASLSRIPFP